MDSATFEKILAILDEATDMTIATVRADGYPQATAVGFVHDGVTLYFGTAGELQKARNIAHCDKVSVAVTLPYDRWDEISRAFHGRPRGAAHRPCGDRKGRPPHAEEVFRRVRISVRRRRTASRSSRCGPSSSRSSITARALETPSWSKCSAVPACARQRHSPATAFGR